MKQTNKQTIEQTNKQTNKTLLDMENVSMIMCRIILWKIPISLACLVDWLLQPVEDFIY